MSYFLILEYPISVILQANVYQELVRCAEGFMDGVVSVAKSYFNVSGPATEQATWFERENAKLREKEARLNSSNAGANLSLEEQEERVWILESELKEMETLEATLHSRVCIADLQKHRQSWGWKRRYTS